MTPHHLLVEYQPLREKNWFKTGGAAHWYAEPRTAEEFQSLVRWAQEQQHPIFVLGDGANILISDEGFPGLVIRPQLCSVQVGTTVRPAVPAEALCEGWECSEPSEERIEGSDERVSTCPPKPAEPDGPDWQRGKGLTSGEKNQITAGAGTLFADLITTCLTHQLGGLEEFSGIPGTVGGSVFINIHYFNFLLSDFLIQARVINKTTGEIITVPREWFNFGYDYSTLHSGEWYLVDATFQLKKVSLEESYFARGRQHEIIRHRRARYPNSHTCGSFFRNFHDHEVTLESNGKKLIFAAYYLDKVGVKGSLSSGDAIVSWQHANMIVNRGSATSRDIITLARMMQERVYEQFGVMLQPECQLIGTRLRVLVITL